MMENNKNGGSANATAALAQYMWSDFSGVPHSCSDWLKTSNETKAEFREYAASALAYFRKSYCGQDPCSTADSDELVARLRTWKGVDGWNPVGDGVETMLEAADRILQLEADLAEAVRWRDTYLRERNEDRATFQRRAAELWQPLYDHAVAAVATEAQSLTHEAPPPNIDAACRAYWGEHWDKGFKAKTRDAVRVSMEKAVAAAVENATPSPDSEEREMSDEELYQMACDLHADSVDGNLVNSPSSAPSCSSSSGAP